MAGKRSVNEMIKADIAKGVLVCPVNPQGVNKERITYVLKQTGCYSDETRDVVFALLDECKNWYPNAPKGSKFSDGACTAHLGAHVAILQRKSDAKLDREGRDYWIKPLADLGIVEACYLPSSSDKALLEHGNKFYSGHLKAKSPNNAYRLAPSFVEILKSPTEKLDALLEGWTSEDAKRERLKHQAELAAQAKQLTDNSHSELIQACCRHYAPRFLPGYEVIYIDDGDGDRVTDEQRAALKKAGLTINIGDAMPDVLLWNREKDSLWVIEAVTSDGEVDNHKVRNMVKFSERHGKKEIGFTTAYVSWKKLGERQKATSNNLAVKTYFWIMEDASKNFFIGG